MGQQLSEEWLFMNSFVTLLRGFWVAAITRHSVLKIKINQMFANFSFFQISHHLSVCK